MNSQDYLKLASSKSRAVLHLKTKKAKRKAVHEMLGYHIMALQSDGYRWSHEKPVR